MPWVYHRPGIALGQWGVRRTRSPCMKIWRKPVRRIKRDRCWYGWKEEWCLIHACMVLRVVIATKMGIAQMAKLHGFQVIFGTAPKGNKHNIAKSLVGCNELILNEKVPGTYVVLYERLQLSQCGGGAKVMEIMGGHGVKCVILDGIGKATMENIFRLSRSHARRGIFVSFGKMLRVLFQP